MGPLFFQFLRLGWIWADTIPPIYVTEPEDFFFTADCHLLLEGYPFFQTAVEKVNKVWLVLTCLFRMDQDVVSYAFYCLKATKGCLDVLVEGLCCLAMSEVECGGTIEALVGLKYSTLAAALFAFSQLGSTSTSSHYFSDG